MKIIDGISKIILKSIIHFFILFLLINSLFTISTSANEVGSASESQSNNSIQTTNSAISTENERKNAPTFLTDYDKDLILKHFRQFGLQIYNDKVSPLFKRSLGIEIPVSQNNEVEFIISSEGSALGLQKNLLGFDLEMTREIPQLNMITVRGSINDLNEFLLQNAVPQSITYVEPNVKVSINSVEEPYSPEIEPNGIPNDPLYVDQWGLNKINAPAAWDLINDFTAADDVLVAIIDTGIDYTHPDLAGSYVPLGYNWVDDNDDPMDDNDHGTHVAGIIAATINNSLGIAGIAPVKIMAEKFLDADGFGDLDDGALAIVHAVDVGADILSNSWGAGFETLTISDAIDYATDNGVVVIAAAGNGGRQDANNNFPAAHPSVISVSSSTVSDGLSSFSSYGSSIDVAAPGSSILSTIRGNNYAIFDGTSMATPHVSATVALMLIKQPNLTVDEIRTLLHETSDDLGPENFDTKFGYGRINAERAVDSSTRPTTDLLGSIYLPQTPLGRSIPMEFTMAIHNFGTTQVSSVAVNIYQNGVLYDSFLYSTIDPLQVVKENILLVTTQSGIYNLTLEIEAVGGETNLANNIDTEMVDFGSSSFDFQEIPFDWVDAKIDGYDTGMNDDDGFISVELPFPFNYFNAEFDRVFVSSNGWLSFVNAFPYDYFGETLPNDVYPYLIAPLWNDLIVSNIGDNDNGSLWVLEEANRVIIQYDNVNYYWGENVGSFQVILYDNGEIVFNYLDVSVVESSIIGLNHGVGSNDATMLIHNPPGQFIEKSFRFSETIVTVANEVAVAVFDPPLFIQPNIPTEFALLILNYGTQTVTSLGVDFFVDGTSVLSQAVDIPGGSGKVLYYNWTPTIEKQFDFSFRADIWANETNLVNNVFNYTVNVINSRLSVPYNLPVEYNDLGISTELAFGWVLRETLNPQTAMVEIYIRNRFDNSSEIFEMEFDIITFEDEFGLPNRFIIPNDATVGYQNSQGEITSQTSYSIQGVTRDVFVFEGVYGDQILYDVNTRIMIAMGFVDYSNGNFIPDFIFEFSPIIPLEIVNQRIAVMVNNANIGSEVGIEIYVRNTGSLATTITSVEIYIDGSLENTVNIPILDEGVEYFDTVSVLGDSLDHTLTAVLSLANGESYFEDNTVSVYYKPFTGIPIFQDDFPYGSDFVEFLLQNLGFDPIIFGSADIGNVNLTGFERIIISSDQSSVFQQAVENNIAWFESYVEQGAILQIHAASDAGSSLTDPTIATYSQLPGGVGVFQDGSTFTDYVSIQEQESLLFSSPNFISDTDLDYWGWSAYGYLTNLPLQAISLASFEDDTQKTVIAATPFGEGNIIYTVQPVEAWWANWNLLENLLGYEPEFPGLIPPAVEGIRNIEVVQGSDSELLWYFSSDRPESYEITVDGIVSQSGTWDEPSMVVNLDVSTFTEGQYSILATGTNTFGLSSSFETTLVVTEIELVISTSSTSSATSKSDSDDSSISLVPVLLGISVLTVIVTIRKKIS